MSNKPNIRPRSVPYNTGRVRIGAAYERPVRVPRSVDDDRIQALLLGIREPWDVRLSRFIAHRLPWVVLAVVLVSVAFLVGFGGRHAG